LNSCINQTLTTLRQGRVLFPTGVGNFSLRHHVQTDSGAHSASYPMGTVGSFGGVKRPWCKSDHSHRSTAEVKKYVKLRLHSLNTSLYRGAYLSTGKIYLYLEKG